MKVVDIAIKTLFDAAPGGDHNALYTSLGGRLYNEEAPQQTVEPFGVFHEISNLYEYNFYEDFENILMQFSFYSKKIVGTNTGDAISEINTIYDNARTLFDWASLTVTGYTSLYMRREQSYKMRIDNYMVRIIEYRIYMEKS